MNLYGIIILISAYIVGIFGGAPLVGRVLKNFAISQIPQLEEGLPRAGRMIGMLERSIILTFSFFGDFASISFIFLAKSMARFRQLENRQFAEYYLIGTLLSFFFALLVWIMVEVIWDALQLSPFPLVNLNWFTTFM
ncbi:MAG: hypothetical protein ACE5R6_00985 [Candidatus Heimdallarchaeota archaeon]